MFKVFYILIFVVTTAIFTSIFPYPVLSNHTNITEREAYAINNFNEQEMSPSYNTKTTLLDANFKIVNVLLPIGSEFEIIDLDTQTPFQVSRTGGINHLDVEPTDEKNVSVCREISSFTWKRRPVLAKLNDSAYVPASLSVYPHGYTSIDNTMNGHLCLHFEGSKTDGTKEEDFEHQKAIKNAKILGEKYIKKQ